MYGASMATNKICKTGPWDSDSLKLLHTRMSDGVASHTRIVDDALNPIADATQAVGDAAEIAAEAVEGASEAVAQVKEIATDMVWSELQT